MENVVQQETIQPDEAVVKSTILNEEEVKATLSEGQTSEEEYVLPSEDTFEMPEKFKGKTAEEIAKAYAELEKMKAKQQPQADEPAQDNVSDNSEFINPMLEEGRPEGSQDVPADVFVEFVQEYDSEGQLSEASYAKLEELGYNKAFVDEKIDYINYKREREAATVLEPYGGTEAFKQVSAWAAQNFTEKQLENINLQLASGNRATQDAVLASLFMGYKQSVGTSASQDMTLHTNQPQSVRVEGYATKSEYLKDAKDPRYDKDPAYRKQVEKKMMKTDMSKWY